MAIGAANAISYTARQQQAIKLLEQDQPDQAAQLLEADTAKDDSLEGHELLAAAYYRQEKYDKAAEQFQAALTRDPQNDGLKKMLEQANTNVATRVAEDPSRHPFTTASLMAPPNPGPGFVHTSTIAPRSGFQKLGDSAWALLRRIGGSVAAVALGQAENTMGALPQGPVWTNWYTKPFMQGIAMLGNMRNQLNANNLKDQYQAEGHLSGYMAPGTPVPEWTKWARTADGTFNNPLNPKEGAAGVRFGRNVDLAATAPNEATMMDPSPREISRVLMTRNEGFKEVPFLNMLAASWIQFMVHDWVSHGDNTYKGAWQIPLGPEDPMRKDMHFDNLTVPRTATDPTRRPEEAGMPPGYINENTAWWDGSQIYGSNLEQQMKIRSGTDGKLKMDDKGYLPAGEGGVDETGFKRNYWLGLGMLHNVFSKEHNSVCDMLKGHHPDWSDERLFQTARLIVAAQMAKIHTVEWTPAILPNKQLAAGMNYNWFGGANYMTHGSKDRPVLTHWKPTDSAIGGIVGNPTDNHGVPYSLTEEFVAVYRLHSLLPDILHLHKIGDKSGDHDLALADTREAAAHTLVEKEGLANLLYSFGIEHPGQLVLNNYPKSMQEMVIPGRAFFDLAAVDVLRDRERGIPRYNEFRRQIGLKPIKTFDDLTDNKEQVAELKKVYGNDVEKLDMLIGTLAEGHRPENFGFGETLFQIFILNASRRLQADRFFTSSYNAETYTQEGLDWIDQSSFKNILLRQCPELAQTGLANVENAFEPWDLGKLDPTRHPLDLARR